MLVALRGTDTDPAGRFRSVLDSVRAERPHSACRSGTTSCGRAPWVHGSSRRAPARRPACRRPARRPRPAPRRRPRAARRSRQQRRPRPRRRGRSAHRGLPLPKARALKAAAEPAADAGPVDVGIAVGDAPPADSVRSAIRAPAARRRRARPAGARRRTRRRPGRPAPGLRRRARSAARIDSRRSALRSCARSGRSLGGFADLAQHAGRRAAAPRSSAPRAAASRAARARRARWSARSATACRPGRARWRAMRFTSSVGVPESRMRSGHAAEYRMPFRPEPPSPTAARRHAPPCCGATSARPTRRPPPAVRRYLAQFLRDHRVVEIPRAALVPDPARHHPAHAAGQVGGQVRQHLAARRLAAEGLDRRSRRCCWPAGSASAATA